MATIEVKQGEGFAVVSTNSFKTDGDRVPEFFTKSGWLSGQALACGYVESAEGFTLALDGEFHVRGGGQWETFDKLNLARKHFVRLVKAQLLQELQEALASE